MSNHVYKKLEFVGSSQTSSDDAIKNAIAKAAVDNKYLDWFEVVETRGHLVNGEISHFQVTIKVGCRIED